MAEKTGDGTAQEFHIDGSRIHGISDLYAQVNALLMQDEGWELGESLDALNDVLYRFGPGTGPAVFVWEDHEHSRESLGIGATRRWLEDKLLRPDVFDVGTIGAQRDALLSGSGKTYFEIVQEIFADHLPDVRLELR